MRHDAIRDIILGILIGDALGSGVDGLGKGHIRATFGGITGYIDPAKALKGKIDRWKKPGLYSSLGQLLLLTAMSARMHRKEPLGIAAHLQELIRRMPGGGDDGNMIFRSPDFVERRFIHSSGGIPESSTPSIPGLRIIPLAAALLPCGRSDRDIAILTLTCSFTRDPSTAAGALLYGRLLDILRAEETLPGKSLFDAMIDASGELSSSINSAPHRVFEAGMNPDSILQSLELYSRLCGLIKNERSLSRAEELLCAAVNPLLANPVKRATVNIPSLAIPIVLMNCTVMSHDPCGMLFSIAGEGGVSSACTALTGGILGARSGIDVIPKVLLDTLVNKHRVHSIAASLQTDTIKATDIEEFIAAEAQLTRKESEERRAKMKHSPRREKPRPSKRHRESDLTRPVIESWTKLDKARWKKESRMHRENTDNREDGNDSD